jgi:hypothetical protein
MLWYAAARQQCRTLAKESGRPLIQVCGVVAAVSPRCPWVDNLRRARELLVFGRAASTKVLVDKARRILQTTDREEIQAILHGPKISRFFLNIYSRQHSEVTIDRHAWSALGWQVKMTKGNLAQARQEYQQLAKELGIKPYQLQAITWLTWRRLKSQKGQANEQN